MATYFSKYIAPVFVTAACSSAIALEPDTLRAALAHTTPPQFDGHHTHQIQDWELDHFYRQRDYRPLWQLGDRRVQLHMAVSELASHGLDPSNYPVPESHHDQSATNEITATRSWLQAALDLRFGRVDRQLVEPIWHHDAPFRAQERKSLLHDMQFNVDHPAEAVRTAAPKSRSYERIRREYMRLSAQQEMPPWPLLSAGPMLDAGERGPRVAQLRARLLAEGYFTEAPFGDDFYDEKLVELVRRFQYRHSLSEDARIGPATLAALNVSRDERIRQLRVNLERWRWLRSEWQDTMLVVDIAGASIRYFENGDIIWSTRTLVGRNSRPTPSLKSVISYLTFNPDWTIPPTIMRKDMLPQIRNDLAYLDTKGLQTISYDGEPVDPLSIDWNSPQGVMLRQPPGPENPLGQVVFRFPNPFSVYLHDTSNKNLFGKVRRAGSSGCVRVESAVKLAYLLVDKIGSHSPESIDGILAAGEKRHVNVADELPVLLDYWTVDTDRAGRLIYRPDIYGRDAALDRALD